VEVAGGGHGGGVRPIGGGGYLLCSMQEEESRVGRLAAGPIWPKLGRNPF
jgi:hypothetical protein